MSNEDDDLIKQADEIVKQIQGGNLALTSKARTIRLARDIGKDALGRTKRQEYNLTDLVGNAVSDFLRIKSIKEEPIFEDYMNKIILSKRHIGLHDISCDLIKYIELARAKGVLKNIGIEKLQTEIKELKERLDQYEKENLKLKEENRNLHALVKNLGGESTGDVEGGNIDE
jgi:hypothetical protein